MRKLDSLKSFLTDFFYYTKAERDSQILLMSIILVLFLLGIIIPHFYKPNPVSFSDYEQEILDFELSLKEAESQKSRRYKDYATEEKAENFGLFKFDPNTATIDEFQKLGLSKKVALSIEKARGKNYRFYDKEDLQSFYGIKQQDFERLENYIQITSLESTKKKSYPSISTKPKAPIAYFEFDPNTVTEGDMKKLGLSDFVIKNVLKFRAKEWKYQTAEKFGKTYGLDSLEFQKLQPFIKIEPIPFADSSAPNSYNNVDAKILAGPAIVDINRSTIEEWEGLSGIGPGYAKRIVKFRNDLGGFESIAQIATTFKLPDSTFQKIKPQLRPSPILRKLKINLLTQTQLMEHPYVSRRTAIALSGYVKFNGPITNIEDLVELSIMSQEELQKLKPYLDLSTKEDDP